MDHELAIPLTAEEVELLLDLLEHAYERALESGPQQSRGDGREIGADEPIEENTSEEDTPPLPPTAERIRAIADKITEAYLR